MVDTTSIDLDLALSYIDEKLQNILGHFQKDFEGGVSAEKRGATFGGYGSFLPTYQRSPSIQIHPKIPRGPQDNSTPKSSNNLHLEGAQQNPLVPSDVSLPSKHGTTSLGMHDPKIESANDLVKPGSCLLFTQVCGKECSSTKSDNPTDQKTPRVQIKIGSDNTSRNNATIYSGLGLISPSSSKESSGEPFESQETTPDESPSIIIECMTSLPVTGPMPLSPLNDSLLNLIRKENVSLDNKSAILIRALRKDSIVSVQNSASVLENGKVSNEKKIKSVGKTETTEGTKHGNGVNFEGNNMISLVGKNVEIKEVPLKNEDFNMVLVKNRLISTGLAKEESVEPIRTRDGAKNEHRASKSSLVKIGKHGVRSSEKDISVDLRIGSKIKDNKVTVLFKPEPDVSKRVKDSYKELTNNLKPMAGLRGTQSEGARSKLPQRTKKLSLEVKDQSKGTQSNIKLTSNLADESMRSGVLILNQSKNSAQEDAAKFRVSYEDVYGDISLGHVGNKMNLLERPNLETVKEKDATTNDIRTTKGVSSETELASVAPVIIEEDWVQCDRCQKWRLLPYGIKPDQLPDNWLCSMQNWLPGMNRCDISEEETEKSLLASYKFPLPEGQNKFESHSDRIGQGVTSADIQASRPIKSLRQGDMKNRSLKDRNHLLKTSITNNYTTQRLGKLSVERPADKQKDDEGATMRKQLKAKREPHQFQYESSKRIKTQGALYSENGGDLGKVGISSSSGLPTRTTVKGLQKHSEHHHLSKDETPEPNKKLLVSVKKQRDTTLVLPHSEPLEIKTCNGRAINAKKRKFNDGKVSKTEESGSGEYRKEMKSRVSWPEAQESSTSRGDDGSNKERKVIRIRLSGSRDISGVKDDREKVASQIALDDINSLKRDLGSEQFSTAATSRSSKVSDSHNRSSYQESKGSPVESVSSSPIRASNLDKGLLTSRGRSWKDYAKSGKGSALVSKEKDEKVYYNIKKVTVKFSDTLSKQELNPKKIQRDEMQMDPHNQLAPHHEELIDAAKHVCDGLSISIKDDKNVRIKGSKIWAGSNENLDELRNVDGRVSPQQNSEGEIAKLIDPTHPDSGYGKTQVNLRQPLSRSLKESGHDIHEVGGHDIREVGGSGDIAKVLQQPGNSGHQNEAHQSVVRDLAAPAPNLVQGDFCNEAANNVLKEAEHLRNCTDHLKNIGFNYEANMASFQAALKFLLGASLLETSKYESSKYGEVVHVQIYSSAARLCEMCAHEFEKHQEMAGAALAYKCMEVAYMRLVYCKTSITNKARHELQASLLQIVPQGDSPSSSASGVDNLNNQETVDKAALTIPSNLGNDVIVARHRPNFVRLLDFMNDVSSAMEASRKSQLAFAAANVILKKAQNHEGFISVKRVIDVSFQNVEELVRLVRHANEAISLQCLNGQRD